MTRFEDCVYCAYKVYTLKKGKNLDIIISNGSNQPIYEQIARQMKDAIFTGELEVGAQLPSIRALANDLHVSVITTKRVYQDLEAQGFIETVQGKGSFVAARSKDLLRESKLLEIEHHLEHALHEAQAAGLSVAELHEMLDSLV